jgi:hypothetical protein
MVYFRKKIIIFFTIILAAGLLGQMGSAQIIDFTNDLDFYANPIPGVDLNNLDSVLIDVLLEAIPRTPTANEEVVVKIGAFGYPLGAASYQWSLDGQIKTRPSLGLSEFTFRASPRAGDVHVVGVEVHLPSGEVRRKSLRITVAEVLIGAEYQTLIPPRYRAAALGGNGSTIKFWALPFGLGNDRELLFRWFVDNNKIGEGFDMREIAFNVKGGKASPTKLRLQLLNNSQQIDFEQEVNFMVWDEEIELYEVTNGQQFPNPNRSFAFTGGRNGRGTHVIAWPYYFNAVNPARLNFNWSVNGERFQTRGHILDLTGLSAPGTPFQLDVQVLNPSSFLERANFRAGIMPSLSQ